MVLITIVTGAYKPTNITGGGTHCIYTKQVYFATGILNLPINPFAMLVAEIPSLYRTTRIGSLPYKTLRTNHEASPASTSLIMERALKVKQFKSS
jgi:hypothetical protein